jgi:micrococcal nuclease
MKWKIYSVLAVIVLFFVLNFLVSESGVDLREEKIVTKIIDGDTIIVQGGETIRLLGFDCDERGKSCYMGAKERIEELILGKSVILESENEDKDIYGRSLRYVFLDGENIDELMVREGYCVARFPEDSKYKKEIVEAEEFAILNKVGCKWEDL